MRKLLSCTPSKFEHLFFWARSQQERDGDGRWQLQEKDEDQGIIIVELLKGKNQSLGITISGGTDKSKEPFVANIRPGSLADKSDYFCVGDPILEINETDIKKLKHGEIIKFIQDCGKCLRFKMVYKNINKDGLIRKTSTLRLSKEHDELKYKLRGGKSKDGLVIRPVIIADLDQKSEIARNGEVLEGDAVLAIDDKRVDNLHISEIRSLFKQTKADYTLKIEYDVNQKGFKETERGSIIVDILRPNENVDPGLALDVSLENEHLGSIIVISEIKESGIAERTGSLKVGDLVLALNGISMDGISVDQARQMMNCSSKAIQLEIKHVASELVQCLDTQKPYVDKNRPVVNDPERFNSEAVAATRPVLNQYPSKTLTLQRRLNSQDRAALSSKSTEYTYATIRTLNSKRGMLGSSRFGSFDDSRSVKSACSSMSQCNLGTLVGKAENMSVVLIAEDYDYGLEIQDGLKGLDTGFIVVSSVVNGKAAERSGVIQPGDRIISINGIRTDYMAFEEFQKILYESVTSLRLEIEFDVTDSVVPSSGTFTMKIPRSENTGISLAETHHDDLEKYPRVVDVKRGSVAYRLGILQAGDQIVHINGASTNGMSIYEANEMIRRCFEIMRITVKKDEEIQGNTFAVEFDRKGKQLGITISGSDEHFEPIYITSVLEDGVAGRSGAVSVGDRLLAINGESLRGKPLWKAYSMLRSTGDVIKLLIKRPSNSPITNTSSCNECQNRSCTELNTSVNDVQQWILNTNISPESCVKKMGNISHLQEQDRCPVSSHSGSSESYCDISDAGDTQSSHSESQNRIKKNTGSVCKRPVLPAWQRECLKNYGGKDDNKLEEVFTRSDNFSPGAGAVPRSWSSSGNIVLKPGTSGVIPLASREKAFDNSNYYENNKAIDSFKYPVCNGARTSEISGNYSQTNGSGVKNPNSQLISHFSYRDQIKPMYLGANNELPTDSSIGNVWENSRFHKQKEQALDRSLSPRDISNGIRESENSSSVSSLTISPFQIDLPSKSERYLRDLERKTEAQYNDIVERLERTTPGTRVDTVVSKSNSLFPVKLHKIVTSPTSDNVSSTKTNGEDNKDMNRPKFEVGADMNNDSNSEDSPSVTLHRIVVTKRGSEEDFGFSVAGRVDGSGIYVKSIQSTDGITRRSGKLKKYDRILQVNGIYTRDLSCDQIVPLLQRAGRRLQLVVERVNKD